MSRLTTHSPPRSRLRGHIRRFEPPLRPVPSGPEYTELECVDGRRVFIHREVLDDLAALERAEHPRESAGLLFGRIFTDGTHQCALVRHLIRPLQGEVIGTQATVTITAAGSSGMSARAQRWYPCADAVGWAHTHPTFNAYFSGTDRAEQAVWTSPASVGLVMSGLESAQPPFEVYVGPESEPTAIVGDAPASTRPPAEERGAVDAVVPPTRAEPSAAAPRTPARRRSNAGSRERVAAAIAAALVLAVLVGALWVGRNEEARPPEPSVAVVLEAGGDRLVRSVSFFAAAIERGIGNLFSAISEVGRSRAEGPAAAEVRNGVGG